MKQNRIRKTIIYFLYLLIALTCFTGCQKNLEVPSAIAPRSLSDEIEASAWFDSIPEYRGTPYVEVNHDIPFFTDEEKQNRDAFEIYSELDSLGRCGVAYANICEELMPVEDRESSLSSVTPSGWCQNQYDGEWLLNRCHLIGYQLAGENANEKNLISGTRYFNVDGMLPFENTVADYINDNPNRHVLYRVTPVYHTDEDLMACGVLIEAWSVEDNGYGCQFCVYVYNVQPGIEIDYATGENRKTGTDFPKEASPAKENATYILNVNSKKFHKQDCTNTKRITETNRSTYNGSRNDLISQGYEPAKCCNP